MQFRWNDWNRDHIAEHGVDSDEAELIVRQAKKPFPRKIEEDKWLVIGRGIGGRFVQVIYVVDDDKTVFIIHARPLTNREKRACERGGSYEADKEAEAVLGNDRGATSRRHEAIR
jgi:uncharacterized DUF497 family protein